MTLNRHISQPKAAELWNLLPGDFNEWRAKNDLPPLLNYCARILPGFSDWQATLPFGRETMLRVVPTGELFKGESVKALVERQYGYGEIASESGHLHSVYYHSASLSEARALEAAGGVRPYKIMGEFLPYFAWAKKHLGRKRFFNPTVFPDVGRERMHQTFVYSSWRGTPAAEGGTGRLASLFGEFDVLKLGDLELDDVDMSNRNLDFADLDHLTLVGRFYGSRWKTVSFSSCDRWRLKGCEAWFFTFHRCAFPSPMDIDQSKIQDFYFEHVEGLALSATGSSLFRLGITHTPLVAVIKDCQLREVKFTPPPGARPEAVATTYRMLRAAYQSAGQRQEASACYYSERKYERKSLYWPYGGHDRSFNAMVYGGKFTAALRAFRAGGLDSSGLRSAWTKVLFARLKLTFSRQVLSLLRSKIRWAASMFEELLWGYGERPGRIVLWIIAIIPLYAVAYHFQSLPNKAGGTADWVDVFYFSAVTFTTLGYGDITPTTETLKLLSGTEALLGGLSLGLVVAGFSNRSRY
jgi:hypothetical protein